ncbi:MAG: hypothetical protein LBL47_05180, partial [Lactobacillus sp.]|nr:hypothetical protein [Lactobacillus sp.]
MKIQVSFIASLLCFTAISTASAVSLNVTTSHTIGSTQTHNYDSNADVSGIYASGTGGTITSNYDLSANGNYNNLSSTNPSGVYASSGGRIGFASYIGGLTLTTNSNAGSGILASDMFSNITISNFNVIANGNDYGGIQANTHGVINISSSNGNNKVTANINATSGIHAGSHSNITITNMDVEAIG